MTAAPASRRLASGAHRSLLLEQVQLVLASYRYELPLLPKDELPATALARGPIDF